MASGRDLPGLLMAFSGPEMDWGRQRVTRSNRIKTGRRGKLERENRKVGGGGRMKAWDLEVPGLEPEAILHRKFPTHSLCIPNEVGDHQLSSRSESIETFQPKTDLPECFVCSVVGEWKKGEGQNREARDL